MTCRSDQRAWTTVPKQLCDETHSRAVEDVTYSFFLFLGSSSLPRSAETALAKLSSLSHLSPPRTCWELFSQGSTLSGKYFLDPDGKGSGGKPVQLYCDMKTGN